MIGQWQPWHLILVGLILLLIGFMLPLLMVLGLLPSTFLLNFIAYATSVSGLLLGMIGAAFYARIHRQ